MRGTLACRGVLAIGAVAAASLFPTTALDAAPRGAPESSQVPADTRLVDVAFHNLSRGVGLFAVEGSTRCQARVARTSNGGASFSAPVGVVGWPCDTNPPVSALALDDEGDAFLYGPRLYVSHDGGARWARSPQPGEVLSVATVGASVWMLETSRHWPTPPRFGTREGLRLYRSANGGRTFTVDTLPAGAYSYSSSPEQDWLVRVGPTWGYVESSAAASGTPARTPLWLTEDAGASWSRRSIPCVAASGDVALSATPTGVLFATCGFEPGGGQQMKETWRSTTDARSWQDRSGCRLVGGDLRCAPTTQTSGYVSEIDAVSASTVYLVGGRSPLQVSRDGGIHWAAVPPGLGSDAGGTDEVVFFNLRAGVVLGDGDQQDERPVLWHTSDGGARWSTVVPHLAA